jgi:rod shape-determining protein MreD
MKIRTMVIALAVAIVLQASVVPYIAIGPFRPDLVILVLVFSAARLGPFIGIIAGFATGLVVDSLSTGYLGLSSFTFSIVAFLVGKTFYTDGPLPLDRWAVASGVGTLANSLLFAYFYSLGVVPSYGTLVLKQVLPMVLYTWVLGMLWGISPLYEKRRGMRLE